MGLQGEDGYPHEGVVNFINNKVDPYTGTITLRGDVQKSQTRRAASGCCRRAFSCACEFRWASRIRRCW